MLDQNRRTGDALQIRSDCNLITSANWHVTRHDSRSVEIFGAASLKLAANGHTLNRRAIPMKISLIALVVAAGCLAGYAQQAASPSIDTVNPPNGKVGAVITATGQNLQKDVVAKLYLTDGKNDIQVAVTEQTSTSIKFTIPDKAAGRMSLMILTADKDPKLMELPVKVSVDN
jgi:hypothetical protein